MKMMVMMMIRTVIMRMIMMVMIIMVMMMVVMVMVMENIPTSHWLSLSPPEDSDKSCSQRGAHGREDSFMSCYYFGLLGKRHFLAEASFETSFPGKGQRTHVVHAMVVSSRVIWGWDKNARWFVFLDGSVLSNSWCYFWLFEAKTEKGVEMLVLCRLLKHNPVASFFFHGQHPSLDCIQRRAELEWPPLTMGTDIVMVSISLTSLASPYSICTPTSVMLVPGTKDAERNMAEGRNPRHWSLTGSGSQIHCLQIHMMNYHYPMVCGDLNGKEIFKKGVICVHITDSHCCTEETTKHCKALYSNKNV